MHKDETAFQYNDSLQYNPYWHAKERNRHPVSQYITNAYWMTSAKTKQPFSFSVMIRYILTHIDMQKVETDIQYNNAL